MIMFCKTSLHRSDPDVAPDYLTVSSSGPAADNQSRYMGVYQLTETVLNNFPVYKMLGSNNSIYVHNKGYWSVFNELNPNDRDIYHRNNDPTPPVPPASGWRYWHGEWDYDYYLTVTARGKN